MRWHEVIIDRPLACHKAPLGHLPFIWLNASPRPSTPGLARNWSARPGVNAPIRVRLGHADGRPVRVPARFVRHAGREGPRTPTRGL